jgi:broad specificity phosphatase PhoE
VDAGANYAIPVQTPFTLTATGSDADGDTLTFAWEQRDIGPAAQLDDLDDGRIPLFRSFNPTTDPSRTFPRWPDILNQTSTLGEQLPRQPRRMNFRVTARDNRSGGGGTNGDDLVLRVVDTAGPFTVTLPNTQSIQSDLLNVTWDVANTDKPPVDTQFVNILLSTDGGRSFSTILASATVNDGEEIIALPAEANSNLRIMVAAVDNVFFAVSPENFNIEDYQAEVFVVRHAEKGLGSDPALTAAGTRRAAFLARLLSVGRIDAVYSTSTRRTMQTAQPTADAAGVSITNYTNEPDLISELKSLNRGERVLVVGHSNTVGPILNGLGVSQSIQIDEDEFDNLFIATLTNSGTQSQRLRFLSHHVAPVNARLLSAPMTAPRPSTESGGDATLRMLEEKLDLILKKLDEG